MNIFLIISAAIAAPVPKSVSFSIRAKRVFSSDSGNLKRSLQNRPSLALGFSELDYFVDFSIGTPPQTIVAALDTWYSDTWVYSGKENDLYHIDASSTANLSDSTFRSWDKDGNVVSGNYCTDFVQWSGSTFSYQFGVVDAEKLTLPTHVFGIGLSTSNLSSVTERNILFAMKEAGIVDSVAYTLLYEPEYKSYSRLLVGEQDRRRFRGELQVLPIVDNNTYTVQAQIQGTPIKVILDHGTVYSFLPDDLIKKFATDAGANYDSTTDNYWVHEVPSLKLSCVFGSVKIEVPPEDLWESASGRYSLTLFSNRFSSGLNILGDNFLLSAYAVFDSEKRQISIAPSH